MNIGVFLYDPKQVKYLSLLPALEKDDKREIIACGLSVEFALEKANISFQSARRLRTDTTAERLVTARAWGISIFEHPFLEFLSYRYSSIGKLFIPPLQYYLGTFLYYLDILAGAFTETTYERVITFSPTEAVSPTGGALSRFVIFTFPDALALICAQKKLFYHCIEIPVQNSVQNLVLKRTIFGWGIQCINAVIASLVRPKKIRILASENWKNIAPFMHELSESELVLLDRAEVLQVGLRGIIAHRMLFVHSENYIALSMRKKVRESTRSLQKQWEDIEHKEEIFKDMTYRGYELEPLLIKVVGQIIEYGAHHVTKDIEGVYALCKRIKPDIIIVRAGTSAQTHFAVLCAVAQDLNIPSLEVQHGTLYFGPESFSWPRAAEYVGEYGPLVRKDFNDIGYDDEHLFDIGSPRFDTYERTGQSISPRSTVSKIVCICPQVVPGFWTDSYDVFDYFFQIAKSVQNIDTIEIIIKLRPAPSYGDFYREMIDRAFTNVPHLISQYESLVTLFTSAEIIITCFSTALTEGIISAKPTVYYTAGIPMYETFLDTRENKVAIDEGALITAHETVELEQIVRHYIADAKEQEIYAKDARAFIAKHYSFDGESAARLAEVIRNLTKKI